MATRFTEDHEWLNVDGGVATVGITPHAQDALGDVVFVDLPEVGKVFAAKDIAGVVESVKAAADVYAPLAGTVVDVNQAVVDAPETVNQDAYAAWLFRMRPNTADDLATLLDAAAYQMIVDAA